MKSEIVVCQNCHLKVLLKAGGTCPNCQASFSTQMTHADENEDVTERYEDNDTDEESQHYSPKSINQYPAPKPLSGINRILYSYPTVLLAGSLWLFGGVLAFLWHTYHPIRFPNSDGITISVAFFFFGLGVLIYAVKGESMSGRSMNSWIVAVISIGISLLILFASIFHLE